ncbi:hypothetical protein TL16_g06260 [Triparma laevis f. inornata]|uniref:Uncharacterized protein n=1 Tax=Triparma laevis f. inornata TaxID=1714386 RepID=A0A9W7AQM1_9STRA|nr:hypothetical protein TL16_g06260 [Triparma laevis f. inornata]
MATTILASIKKSTYTSYTTQPPPAPPVLTPEYLLRHYNSRTTTKSPRFWNSTTSLWTLLCIETNPSATTTDLSNIIDAVNLRIQSSISCKEFTTIFSHWVISENGVTPTTAQTSLSVFRSLILLLDMDTAALDLFLGILIHESNRRMLLFNDVRGGGVGVVSPEWIDKCQKLWFTVDVGGQGFVGGEGLVDFCLLSALCAGAPVEKRSIAMLVMNFATELKSSHGKTKKETTHVSPSKLIMSAFGSNHVEGSQAFSGPQPRPTFTLQAFKRYCLKNSITTQSLVQIYANMKRLKEILGSVRSPIFQVLGIEPEEPVQHLPAWLQAGMVGGKEWLDGTGQAEELSCSLYCAYKKISSSVKMQKCLADPAYHFIYKCCIIQQSNYSKTIFELRKIQIEGQETWSGSLPIRWGDVRVVDERVFKVDSGFVDGSINGGDSDDSESEMTLRMGLMGNTSRQQSVGRGGGNRNASSIVATQRASMQRLYEEREKQRQSVTQQQQGLQHQQQQQVEHGGGITQNQAEFNTEIDINAILSTPAPVNKKPQRLEIDEVVKQLLTVDSEDIATVLKNIRPQGLEGESYSYNYTSIASRGNPTIDSTYAVSNPNPNPNPNPTKTNENVSPLMSNSSRDHKKVKAENLRKKLQEFSLSTAKKEDGLKNILNIGRDFNGVPESSEFTEISQIAREQDTFDSNFDAHNFLIDRSSSNIQTKVPGMTVKSKQGGITMSGAMKRQSTKVFGHSPPQRTMKKGGKRKSNQDRDDFLKDRLL